jgi:hypothetical protein
MNRSDNLDIKNAKYIAICLWIDHVFGEDRTMKTLMIAAAAAIASPVSAEDWRLVNWDSETVLYIDHARLTPGAGTVKYWARVVYLKDPAYAEIVSQVAVRCDARLYKNINITGIYRTGATHAERPKAPWAEVAPGTNIEREMQHVCR